MGIINLSDNDTISLMNNNDRKELLEELKDYYLEYRRGLGFSNKVTFGFEIELEDLEEDIVGTSFEKNLPKGWKVEYDDTLEKGAEIITSRLIDKSKTWKDLRNALYRARCIGKVGFNTGSHIHIGAQVLGTDVNVWKRFLKIWSVYENIIFRFCYGEHPIYRPFIIEQSCPLSELYWYYSKKDYENYLEILTKINFNKFVCVNFKNFKDGRKERKNNTIEFRCPNGTLDEVIWQNNLNLFVHILEYCRCNTFNDEIINRRKNTNKDIIYNLAYYNEIDIDMALEFADLIFTNNIDKIYFLRQYIKNSPADEDNIYCIVKSFTRTLK